MSFYALVDCNNFYASCERAFNPALESKPVVVLSNNDGCIIARSAEAKQLGIKMGAPYWKIRKELKQQRVNVFSSNYPLYGDMSERIMCLLQQYCSDMEVYSIDEAFLLFDGTQSTSTDLVSRCREIRQYILQCTGIPVSIGLARTKTLSKVANHIAKKHTSSGVFLLDEPDLLERALKWFPTNELWGVGRKNGIKLKNAGIQNAWQLRNTSSAWIRKQFGVQGLRLQQELQETPCYLLETNPTLRKNRVVSRSFNKTVCSLYELREAAAVFCTRLGEKLRKEEVNASAIGLSLHLSPFEKGQRTRQKHFSVYKAFDIPTSNTNDLIQMSEYLLQNIFREGLAYKKLAIHACDLQPESAIQGNLFFNTPRNEKFKHLMQTMDNLNTKMGKQTVSFAATQKHKISNWEPQRGFTSPAYTTNWKDLLKI